MTVRPKFAVVREDAALEAELVRRTSARQVLVVASGGCTALTLRHTPVVSLTSITPVGGSAYTVADFDVDTSAVVALERDDLCSSAGIHHRGQHTGPFSYIHRRPEQVNGVAAGPHLVQRHPLDHGHREPLPVKPVGRRRARDART